MSNVGLNTFIYPYGNDKLTTFMNSSISNDDFLGKLKDGTYRDEIIMVKML